MLAPLPPVSLSEQVPVDQAHPHNVRRFRRGYSGPPCHCATQYFPAEIGRRRVQRSAAKQAGRVEMEQTHKHFWELPPDAERCAGGCRTCGLVRMFGRVAVPASAARERPHRHRTSFSGLSPALTRCRARTGISAATATGTVMVVVRLPRMPKSPRRPSKPTRPHQPVPLAGAVVSG